MIEYLPRPKRLGVNMKVESDLSNYATRADLRNATIVDISEFSKQL